MRHSRTHVRGLTPWNPRKVERFQRRLLAWYDFSKRDLPWRTNPDPYRVWLSEVMLQQTQVRTMLPYYRRFIERFPDVQSLASSSEEEVLSLWSGLGYYSRARNLRLAALRILNDFNGRVPDDIDALQALPGIGRYTAGAIHSIAFGSPQPIVDGNVKRVISRLHGLMSRVPESHFWEQARTWVSRERPSEFNQAVMELGALVCTRSKPECARCPVARFCRARSAGIQDLVPAPRAGRAPEKTELVMLVLECSDRLLVREQNAIPYIPGPCSLPLRILADGESPGRAARRLARTILGHPAKTWLQARIRHAITFRSLVAHVFRLRLDGAEGELPGYEGHRWIACSDASRFLTSGLFHKALNSQPAACSGYEKKVTKARA